MEGEKAVKLAVLALGSPLAHDTLPVTTRERIYLAGLQGHPRGFLFLYYLFPPCRHTISTALLEAALETVNKSQGPLVVE